MSGPVQSSPFAVCHSWTRCGSSSAPAVARAVAAFVNLNEHVQLLADKPYDGARVRGLIIKQRGATLNISPKNNRRRKACVSRHVHRERHLLERFFAKLKHFLGIAAHYDELTANFRAMVKHRIDATLALRL